MSNQHIRGLALNMGDWLTSARATHSLISMRHQQAYVIPELYEGIYLMCFRYS